MLAHSSVDVVSLSDVEIAAVEGEDIGVDGCRSREGVDGWSGRNVGREGRSGVFS